MEPSDRGDRGGGDRDHRDSKHASASGVGVGGIHNNNNVLSSGGNSNKGDRVDSNFTNNHGSGSSNLSGGIPGGGTNSNSSSVYSISGKERKSSKKEKKPRKKGKKNHSSSSIMGRSKNDEESSAVATSADHQAYEKFNKSSETDYNSTMYGDTNINGAGGGSSRGRDREKSSSSSKKGSKKRKMEKKAKAEAAALALEKEEASRRSAMTSLSPSGVGAYGSSNATGSGSGRKHKKSKQNQSSSNVLDQSAMYSSGYTAEQANVNDMMRRALEEDQYSALGSIVDTDSSDDENVLLSGGSGSFSGHGRPRQQQVPQIDRNMLLNANRKRLRAIRSVNINSAYTDYPFKSRSRDLHNASSSEYGDGRQGHQNGSYGAIDDGENVVVSAGRKKKRKKGKFASTGQSKQQQLEAEHSNNYNAHGNGHSDNDDHGDNQNNGNMMDTGDNNSKYGSSGKYGTDEIEVDIDDDDSSIYGNSNASVNSTWVQCDRCQKWRRLRGVQDGKKLPTKWYCSMNKNDPERASCSAPEEDYGTPESATDQRARKHLRLWVRRLQCNEAYEARLPPNMMTTRGKNSGSGSNVGGGSSGGIGGSGGSTSAARSSRSLLSHGNSSSYAKEPYEWIRCCNPSCGKWRALLKFMDANTVMENCKNGEWYCVLNTWDEKFASCAAPQENLPAIGCPSWVMQDQT